MQSRNRTECCHIVSKINAHSLSLTHTHTPATPPGPFPFIPASFFAPLLSGTWPFTPSFELLLLRSGTCLAASLLPFTCAGAGLVPAAAASLLPVYQKVCAHVCMRVCGCVHVCMRVCVYVCVCVFEQTKWTTPPLPTYSCARFRLHPTFVN